MGLHWRVFGRWLSWRIFEGVACLGANSDFTSTLLRMSAATSATTSHFVDAHSFGNLVQIGRKVFHGANAVLTTFQQLHSGLNEVNNC